MKYATLVYGFAQSILLCLEDCDGFFLTVNSAQLEPTEKRVLMRNYLGQVDLWASLLETCLDVPQCRKN